MIDFFREFAESMCGYSLAGVSDFVILLMGIVGTLIIGLSIVSLVVELYLAIKYVRFNRKQNSLNMTGKDVARKILDDNGLENIKVKSTGSILFGNSYSHYFKKVRLRRLTWKKTSVSSLAMASQKCSLAILDKEGDPDMKTRVKLTPLIYFGPLFCVPLVMLGLLIDILIIHSETLICTMIFSLFGFSMYIISFIMSIKILKTEIKAQNKAYEILKNNNMATEEELGMLKELFKLYNIEYINNMIMALLELIYRILQIVAEIQANKD